MPSFGNYKSNIKNERMKRIISLWPFGIIFIIWFLFASPFLIKGKTVYPSTYQMNNFAPWDAYPQFAGPVKNGAMPDIISQIYPWKHFTIEQWKKGEIPLWNPYSFSGTPHLANYQSAVLSPLNILFFIFPFLLAWNINIVLQPLLAGLFIYTYARSLRITKPGSLLSAIGFMFCGFIVSWMDYGTLAYAILFLPLSLFAMEEYARTTKFRYLLLLAISIPLSFFSGHFQMSIYFFLVIVSYACFISYREKKFSLLVWTGVYIAFGLFLSMPQILPSLEFYTQSVRSNLFQPVEVIPWAYIPTLLAPDFYGNPVTRNDWFGHYAEWNGYSGLVSLMLGVYSIRRQAKTIFFFLSVAIISLLLAFPSPLLSLMVLLHTPVLSTSSAGRIIVLFSFAIAILSGFGFDSLWADIQKKNVKPFVLLTTLFALFFFILWVIISRKLFLPIEKILIARQNTILPTIFFVLIIAIVVFALLAERMKKTKISFFILSFLAITSGFEMLRFSTKWQAFDPSSLVYPNISVINGFHKIEGYDRVLGNFGGETAVYYHLPSVEGYDALYIKNYGQLLASMTTGKLQDSYRSVVLFTKNTADSTALMKLLNITYIVHKKADDYAPWAYPYWENPSQFQRIYEDGAYRILKNNNALPHAFIVHHVKVIQDRQEILSTLFSKDFNPMQEAIVDKNPSILPSGGSASVTINSYSGNKVTLNYTSDSSAFLILLDNNYPGWNAYIDSQKVPIFTTDYAFRGIAIPKGTHTVSFIYQPVSFILGLWLFLIGIVGGVLGFLLMERKITKI